MYSINFTVVNETFCLSLIYNGDSSYLFVNDKERINVKAKDSEIKPYPLCLGHISVEFHESVTDPGLNGYVTDFSLHYNAIKTSDVLDIHNYLMKKNNIV